jgi:uncharacterized protein (DUF2141 family)
MVLLAAVLAPGASAAEVRVHVRQVANSDGTIVAALCDQASFRKRCPMRQVVPAMQGQVIVSFSEVPPGRYAIQLFHDQNGNGKLDVNAFGLPNEAYAFSRDAIGRFGPPDFDAAAFEVGKQDVILAVTLR